MFIGKRIIPKFHQTVTFCKKIEREIHLTKVFNINPNNVSEVQIPVPWGHVAGKWWGNTSKQPVLALHGWQDNAGSFDSLIELLPDSTPVLALDLPGHGFSSHYDEGLLYNFSSFVMVIRRVYNYYSLKNRLTIIGHSGGGVIAFAFSAIYPEFVDSLITLDAVKPLSIKDSNVQKLGERVDRIIAKSTRKFGDNPKYSFEEIQNRWIESTRGSLTLEAVDTLSKRGVQFDHVSNKYYLNRDPKLKLNILQHFDEKQYLEMADSIECNYLCVRYSESKFINQSLTNHPDFVSVVSKKAKSFKEVIVKGAHHAHLTNPKPVALCVTEWLKKEYSNVLKIT